MLADCSGVSSPSSAASRIVGVMDDSVDTEVGFPPDPLPHGITELGGGPMFIVAPSARLTFRDGGLLNIRG
jgi:hypothetical protein